MPDTEDIHAGLIYPNRAERFDPIPISERTKALHAAQRILQARRNQVLIDAKITPGEKAELCFHLLQCHPEMVDASAMLDDVGWASLAIEFMDVAIVEMADEIRDAIEDDIKKQNNQRRAAMAKWRL